MSSRDDHHSSESASGWVDRVQTLKTRLLKSRRALVTRAQELYLRADIEIELPQVVAEHGGGSRGDDNDDDNDDDDDDGRMEFCVPTERASAALVGVWEDEQVRNIAFMKTVSRKNRCAIRLALNLEFLFVSDSTVSGTHPTFTPRALASCCCFDRAHFMITARGRGEGKVK